MKRSLICTLLWLLVFHWWVVLRFVPPLRDLLGPIAFTQALYWISIPGMPLARVMGPKHFGVEEFGALPAGPLEYALIALFWTIVASILGFGTSAFWGYAAKGADGEKNIQQSGST